MAAGFLTQSELNALDADRQVLGWEDEARTLLAVSHGKHFLESFFHVGIKERRPVKL